MSDEGARDRGTEFDEALGVPRDAATGSSGTAADAATRVSTPRTAPTRLAHARTTLLDGWWAALMSDPVLRRRWDIGAPIAVALLAAVLRLWNLGSPHELVFDETYYVKDADSLRQLGYEGTWPDKTDDAFAAGHPPTPSAAPAFVVHPPLGKWIIAGGLALFGDGSGVGWRIATALVGIALVVVTMLIAKRMFGSTLAAVLAGGLLAIDGNAIVMSRVALLDNSVALFGLLGAGAVLLDRAWAQRRLSDWVVSREIAHRPTHWGPVLWWRPWLIAAGLAFGAASAVKWNGFYLLAVFAVYALGVEAVARWRVGIPFWFSSTVLRQGPATFLLTVPIALAVNVASWAGWFATQGGYYRRWLEDTRPSPAWHGALEWVPYAVQNWWHYQVEIYHFHVNEHDPHPYQANPLSWLFLVRPTSMYYRDFGDGTMGAITGIANPLIWWAGTAALVFALVRLIRNRDWRMGFVLIGIAAGYLPWLLYLNRTVFQFYTIVFEPFMVLAIVGAILALAGSASDPLRRRRIALTVIAVFLGLCVLLSAFWYPLWTGIRVPEWFLRSHYWLRSWI